MISVSNFILAIVAKNTEPAPIIENTITLPYACWVIDLIILSLAMLITLRLSVKGIRREGLSNVWLERPNSVREDVVLWLLLIFFTVQTMLASALASLNDDPENLSARAMFSFITGSGTQLIAAIACLVLASQRFVGGAGSFLFGPYQVPQLSIPFEPQAEYNPDSSGTRAELQPVYNIRTNKDASNKLSITCLILILAWGLCPLTVEVTMLFMQKFNLEFALHEHPTLSALQSDDLSNLLIICLWIGAAVIAPIAEEFFFRGFVQTFLVRVLGSPTKAIFAAAGVFAIIHFPQPQAVPALFLLAVLLGYAYEKTGSIMVPVIIHAGFNLKTLIWDSLATVTQS